MSDIKYHKCDKFVNSKIALIKNPKQLVTCLKEIYRGCEYFSFDTETTGLNIHKLSLVGFSVAWKKGKYVKKIYCPTGHSEGRNIDIDDIISPLIKIFQAKHLKSMAHNFKFDYNVMKKHGIDITNYYFDTLTASWLHNENKKHKLKGLAVNELGVSEDKIFNYKDFKVKEGQGHLISIEDMWRYGADDSDFCYRLFEKYHDEIKKRHSKYFWKVEMPLMKVVADMEWTGIPINEKARKKKIALCERKIRTWEKRIFSEARTEFNINSTQQLGEILFKKLKYPVIKKSPKTGKPSCDVDVLSALSSKGYKIPAYVLHHRKYKKINGTFLAGLEPNDDGCVYSSFWQNGTVSGRFSSSAPNMQNIPRPDNDDIGVRELVQPFDGDVLLDGDYSQIELRVMGHLSQDSEMLEAYSGIGDDLHTRTANGCGVGKDGRHTGKCVHPETLIVDNSNTHILMKEIEQFHENSDTFIKFTKLKRVIKSGDSSVTITSSYNGGIKRLVTVISRYGILTCTPAHKFKTMHGMFIRADSLQEGEELMPIQSHPIRESINNLGIFLIKLWKGIPPMTYVLTKDMCYLCGVILGDGCFQSSSMTISHGLQSKIDFYGNSYSEWQETICNIAINEGLSPVKKKDIIYMGSRVFVRFMKVLEITDGKRKKLRVPSWARNNRYAFLNFMAGLIDSDGSVSKKTGAIEFTTKDFIFAGQLSTIANACFLKHSIEATYNKDYDRYYVRFHFTVIASYIISEFMHHKGKLTRIKKPRLKEQATLPNIVRKVLPAGKGKCLDIETSNHEYNANGFITHNTLNFAWVYGGGIGVAIEILKGYGKIVDWDTVKVWHERYQNLYGRLFEYIEEQKINMQRTGRLRTLAKRIRHIPEAVEPDKNLTEQERKFKYFSMRSGINTLGQGGASDIIKIGMVKVKELCDAYDVNILFQVHDELGFSCTSKPKKKKRFIKEARNIMENCFKLSIPLEFEINEGVNWKEAH